jgi:hypothetical protein
MTGRGCLPSVLAARELFGPIRRMPSFPPGKGSPYGLCKFSIEMPRPPMSSTIHR